MKKLYIANKNYSSWSLRPWVLMHELNIPFEEKLQPLSSGSSWQEFRNFSPNGMVPCLSDSGNVVWDSLSIIEYLAESYPNVWPDSISARAWARSASAEMHSGFSHLRNLCTMNCGLRIELKQMTEGLQKDINRIDELWNQGIKQYKGPYLAGDSFTAVDAFYAPVVFRIQTYDLKLSTLSQEYCTRLLSLNSMKTWYKQALQESWREPGHEQDAIQCGKILNDYRK